MTRRARSWQLGLIMVGVMIATYLTLLHYDAQIPLVCSNHGFVDCESVLSSPESTWFGLPVSLFGLLWFLGYGSVVTFKPKALGVGRGLALVGAATVLYLVFVEFVVLGTVCLWCSSLHLLILTLFGVELSHWSNWQDGPGRAELSRNEGGSFSRKSSDSGESF